MSKLRALLVSVACLTVSGCGAGAPSNPPHGATAKVESVRFGPASKLAPGSVVVHREKVVMSAKMSVDGKDDVTQLDLLSQKEKKTEVLASDEYRIGWSRHRSRTKTNGETKTEASPLEGHTFHLAKRDGHLTVVEDDGSVCNSEVCKKALEEVLSTLSVAKKPAGSGGAASGGSVLDLDAPMSLGEHFDDASALLGDPIAGMRFERVQATLDSVEGGVAQFSVSGTIVFDLGTLSMTIQFKGRVARRLVDRALVEDTIRGPLSFELTSDNAVVHGRGALEIAESWSWK